MPNVPPATATKGPTSISLSDPIPQGDPSPTTITSSIRALESSESKGSREMGLEQQIEVGKMQEERASGGEVLKPLIPARPKEGWPTWGVKYLKALALTRTNGEAADLIERSKSTIYEALQRDPDYAQAVARVCEYRNWLIQSDLESTTLRRAINGDPDDRASATLAMFHLKARDDRYKDKVAGIGGVNIQIVMGHPIGRSTPKSANNAVEGRIIDAEEG